MNKIKITFGDLSEYGHNITEDVFIEVNKTNKEIQDAYQKTCKDIGINPHDDICSEYEEAEITSDMLDELEKAGIPFKEYIDKEDYDYLNAELYTQLIMMFVKHTLPDLVWNNVADDIPCFNNFDREDGRTCYEQFGYGMFE